jgi:hypothetical protein
MDVKPACPTCRDKPAEKKKVVGDFFSRPCTTWSKEECIAFLDLSETVQKRLHDFKTAGKAKSAVLKHLTSLMAAESHPTAPLLSALNLQLPHFVLIVHLLLGLIENLSSQQQPPQLIPTLPAVITGDTSHIDSYIQELKLAIHSATITQPKTQLTTEAVQLNVSNSNDAPQ